MIRRLFIMIGVVLALQTVALATASAREHSPQNLRLTVTTVVDPDKDLQYLYVINDHIAFESVGKLEDYLASRPRNSKLTWVRHNDQLGLEPLGSEDDLKNFQEFCSLHSIRFVQVAAN